MVQELPGGRTTDPESKSLKFKLRRLSLLKIISARSYDVRPIRASLKMVGGDEKILELLRTRMGLLLVNAKELAGSGDASQNLCEILKVCTS